MNMDQDEYTFLCGHQKIRRYGSTNDLNSTNYSNFNRYSRLILHKVEPADTLQSLELKYNSSMYEIKRLNRLWSNNSLHCKTHVNIPIFDDSATTSSDSSSVKSQTSPSDINLNFEVSSSTTGRRVSERSQKESKQSSARACSLEKVEEAETESLDQFFKRIDQNVKKSQKIVRKLKKQDVSLE